jgi:hypothetical protein
VAQRSSRPTAEEGHRGERQRSSTMSTPLELEAPGATQMPGQPAAEEGRRGERRRAWTTREAARHRPLGTRPHLNGAGPGVEVVVMAVRGGGGGAAAGATTAIGSSGVMSLVPTPRLLQGVVVGHWRWWRGTPRSGTAHRRRGAAKGGWVGGDKSLGFWSSGSKKRNLSSDFYVG